MKKRPLLILAFALACGLLSAYLAREYLRAQVASATAGRPETTTVAVAARDLPGGSVLTAADVKMIEWPSGSPPPGYVAASNSLVGQGLVLPVKANEPFLTTKLANASVSGLAGMIPAGMRAVSVKVDEVIAVAGFVTPGTRVDILVTMPSDGAQPGATKLVVQNLKVLASGQSYAPSEEAEAKEASVITLLVTPEQAEVLTLASTEGRIQLALRNTLDETMALTSGAVATTLEGRAPPPAAPAPRGAARSTAPRRTPEATVEIYHGSDRTVASF